MIQGKAGRIGMPETIGARPVGSKAAGLKVAVIGGGISGLTCAHYLAADNDVVVYEADARLGGHTDTHVVHQNEETLSIDSGFIVFNEHNYTGFSELLAALDVPTERSDMSFSVVNEQSGLEYGAAGLKRLFSQKANMLRPDFYRMLLDIARFYRTAPELLDGPADEAGPTLGEYLLENHYGSLFIDNHIIPMASALWSASSSGIMAFPARYFVAFMANHRMLNLGSRPEWRVVSGGSSAYVRALTRRSRARFRCNAAVQAVVRLRQGSSDEASAGRLAVHAADGSVDYFDHVVLACHSDQALKCLAQPTSAESDVLGAIGYQRNHTLLHSDASVLPSARHAWSSWNVRIGDGSYGECRVSYWMNLLQNLKTSTPYIVSLNMADRIAPHSILAERHYGHPVYTAAAVMAQAKRREISGMDGLWYAGAYWGWGFHEDGVRSALDVVQGIDAEWAQTVGKTSRMAQTDAA